MELMILMWVLTILVPIHGLLFLGRRNERKRIRALVVQYWKLRNHRR
jgi:hypothetical protein